MIGRNIFFGLSFTRNAKCYCFFLLQKSDSGRIGFVLGFPNEVA